MGGSQVTHQIVNVLALSLCAFNVHSKDPAPCIVFHKQTSRDHRMALEGTRDSFGKFSRIHTRIALAWKPKVNAIPWGELCKNRPGHMCCIRGISKAKTPSVSQANCPITKAQERVLSI